MKRYEIKVTFDDGDYLYTAINGESEDDVRNHFIGRKFTAGWDDGDRWQEDYHTATGVEFL